METEPPPWSEGLAVGGRETWRPSPAPETVAAPRAPALCLGSLLWTLQGPGRVLPEAYSPVTNAL